MHEVWMHYRTLMLRKLCEKLIKFKKNKAMIVLIVDMDWMGLQSFPNKALLNNDSIWVKHTGKKNWFNLQVTAFHRGQLERFLMSLQRKVKKAQSLSHLNSNASFKTAWQVNGKMHWHKHSQCEQSRWTERAVDVSYSYCDLPVVDIRKCPQSQVLQTGTQCSAFPLTFCSVIRWHHWWRHKWTMTFILPQRDNYIM